MKTKTIEFVLTDAEQASAFANTVRSLNEAGVPFYTNGDGHCVILTITDGY